MKSCKGFTLIELFIVTAIIGIVISMGASFFQTTNSSNVLFGSAPQTNLQCLGGKQAVLNGSVATYITDENNRHIPC